MRYFVEHVLTDDERRSLTEAGVKFEELQIGSPTFHRLGIAFSRENAEAVASRIGIIPGRERLPSRVIDPATGDYTTEDLKYYPVVQPPTAENPIVSIDGGMHAAQLLKTSLEPAYPELRLGMVLDTHSELQPTAARIHKRLLFIRVMSVPEGTQAERLRGSNISLIRVVGHTRDYAVVRNQAGRYVALFKGDADGGTLWLLFSPYDDNGRTMLSYVMHSLARQLHPELGEPESYTEYLAALARRRYIALAQRRIETESRMLDGQLDAAAGSVARAQQGLTEALRQMRLVRRRQDDLAGADPATVALEMAQEMERGLKELQGNADYEAITFEADRVIAVTRPIELTHNGRVYSLGKYRVTITSQETITIQCVEFRAGHQHPHISSGGSPCFGNQSHNFAKLQSELRYGILLAMIIGYLEDGYQPGDSLKNIENFHVPVRRLEEARA